MMILEGVPEMLILFGENGYDILLLFFLPADPHHGYISPYRNSPVPGGECLYTQVSNLPKSSKNPEIRLPSRQQFQ